MIDNDPWRDHRVTYQNARNGNLSGSFPRLVVMVRDGTDDEIELVTVKDQGAWEQVCRDLANQGPTWSFPVALIPSASPP